MLKPLSAISAPLRSPLAGSAAGVAPRAPVGFEAMLVTARQAARANMPQTGGKGGAPIALAGRTAQPLPEPAAEPVDAPVSGRTGREPSLARDRANSDELFQAKHMPDPPGVVPPS